MFYDKLVELCNKKGITLTELTRRIGVNKSNVTYWKRGSEPKSSTLQKIAGALDVSVGELMGLYDEPPMNYWVDDQGNEHMEPMEPEANPTEVSYKQQINDAFDYLNVKGQQKALERVQELTEIPRYQKDKNA